MNNFFNVLMLFGLVSFLSGCKSPDDSVNSQPEIVFSKENMTFVISQSGGCMMAGPNCAEYRLNVSDGSFELLRAEKNSMVEKIGRLDMAIVDRWFSELNQIAPISGFVESLGEGECRGCYDGIDLEYDVVSGDNSVLSLSSQEKGFDMTLEFFQLSEKLHQEMLRQARLEFKVRE